MFQPAPNERSRNTVLVTSTQAHYLSHHTVQYESIQSAFTVRSSFISQTPARADQAVE